MASILRCPCSMLGVLRQWKRATTKANMRKGFDNLLWWGVAIDRWCVFVDAEGAGMNCSGYVGEVLQLYSAERVPVNLKEQVRRRSVSEPCC
jgi:hypothetical protein